MTYEFEGTAEKNIDSFGLASMALGITTILYSIFDFLVTQSSDVYTSSQKLVISIELLMVLGIGVLFVLSGMNYRKIKSTEGNDVGELMNSMNSMRSNFMIVIGLILVILILETLVVRRSG